MRNYQMRTMRGEHRMEPAELGPVAPNLAANMERVNKLLSEYSLEQAFFDAAKDQLAFISNKLNLTEQQSILLSAFMEMSEEDSISKQDICRFMGCSTLKMMGMKDDIEALHKRGFIKIGYSHGFMEEGTRCGYRVPKDVQEAISANKAFEPKSEYNLTIDDLFDHMDEIFEENRNGDEVTNKIKALLEINKQLDFSRKVLSDIVPNCDICEQFIFLLFCNQFVNEGEYAISERVWNSFFRHSYAQRQFRDRMMKEETALQKHNIIENVAENAMFGRTYALTPEAVRTYLSELHLEICEKKNTELIPASSFSINKLFYNKAEGEQVAEITNLLKQKNFKNVQKRLEKMGMRKGFACLFYGAPGTGKTETVNQIARATGRDVMVIDVSQIKNKYVGESEKNIKKAFSRYREYVKGSKVAPILLFNEADAVLGKRMEGAQKSVDKMENSIQNIILQEMEQLDGIMIATTNLTSNLDSAFERRFIFKIDFHNPDKEAKKQIWMSKIPEMREDLAEELAGEFDLSGGQIENIVRKRAVNYVLKGSDFTDEQYKACCREEKIDGKKERARVGF